MVAKSGSKEWYQKKYETAANGLADAKSELKALKAELKELKKTAGGLQIDTSLLSERRQASIRKFFGAAQRYSSREPGQIAAACIANIADGTRRVPVAGLMSRLKRMNGMGLR